IFIMFNFKVTIENIQHIKNFAFELDLSKNKLIAIVGKNGVGKTLLFKAIQNLITSNTFANTSNKHIFHENSQIIYVINNDNEYIFNYNPLVETIDLKGDIEKSIKDNISIELPIPFGERFRQFQRFSEIDQDIRKGIISNQFNKPNELIILLNFIYDTDRFNTLVEIELRNKKYYAIILANNYYIREDYLSSGEYFIISIYKLIQSRCKLIAIDEIDISLDAMAQVRLIEKLRDMASQYEINLLFTTHSLGLMKTLQKDELFYMELENGMCTLENKSYNYIKSLLYGFVDYDKYLLVEDDVLKNFIKHILKKENIFAQYIILPIGGADNVVKLMERNCTKQVLGKSENVMSILDGDVKNIHSEKDNILFLPFESVEKDLYAHIKQGEFITFSSEEIKKYNLESAKEKAWYKVIIREKISTKEEIFDFLISKKQRDVGQFKNNLLRFLNA
ncbi:MAG: ATP-binding cassette domain-containing protein, partial [Sulfuricurvum sp.]